MDHVIVMMAVLTAGKIMPNFVIFEKSLCVLLPLMRIFLKVGFMVFLLIVGFKTNWLTVNSFTLI